MTQPRTERDALGIFWFELPEIPGVWWTYLPKAWEPLGAVRRALAAPRQQALSTIAGALGLPRQQLEPLLRTIPEDALGVTHEELSQLDTQSLGEILATQLVWDPATGTAYLGSQPWQIPQGTVQALGPWFQIRGTGGGLLVPPVEALPRYQHAARRHSYFAQVLDLPIHEAHAPGPQEHLWVAANATQVEGKRVIDGVLGLEPKIDRALEGSRQTSATVRERQSYVWHWWSRRSGVGTIKGAHYFLEGFPELAQLEAMPEIAKLWYTRAQRNRALWRRVLEQQPRTGAPTIGGYRRGGIL